MFIFISGPMTHDPDYKEKFNRAEKLLSKSGYNVLNPAKFNEGLPDNLGKERFLSHDLHLLSAADGIYMLKGWEKSCGCNREYGYALGRNLPIVFEDQDYAIYDKIHMTYEIGEIISSDD